MATTIPDLMAREHGGTITWSDFFCGAGGSSNGLHHVPGFEVKYALNHWDLAVQAHAANFPDTDHEITVIEKVHPSRFGRTDCAWFSPSCTAQAYCGPRGLDDESVRSRATMLDVVRWTAYHRYDAIVVENVIESKLWCDDPSHRKVVVGSGGAHKIKGCSCGSSYDTWWNELEKLGYRGREVYFNSQHALVPQSRDRLYVVFMRDGITKPDLDFMPPCWCGQCESVVAGVQAWKVPSKNGARAKQRLHHWGRYGTQYVYTCPLCATPVAPAVVGSWSIIDHGIPIETIGSRKRPIAAATRKRIKVGLERIGRQQPIQLQVGGNLFERPGYARVWSLDDPLRTITTTPYLAMCFPAGAGDAHGKSGELPSHAITGSDRLGVVLRAGGQAVSPRSINEPMSTITAHDRQVGVVIPNKTNNVGASTELPCGAITTSPAAHMLVTMRRGMDGSSTAEPQSSQTVRADQGMIVYNGVPGFVRALDDAAGTITARDKQGLLVPRHDSPRPSLPLDISEEDIDSMLFRMLQWPELQRGQAMHVRPDGQPYELTARVRTKRGKYKELSNEQRVRMIGNAVSSPVASIIGHSIARALAT